MADDKSFTWRVRPDSGIPKGLPGFGLWDPVLAQKTRPQIFSVSQGHAVVSDKRPLTAPTDPASITARHPLSENRNTLLSHKVTQVNHWPDYQPTTPQWIAYARRVLRFYAYFKETVTESRIENYRVRRCHILYYLEDGTLQVDEPREDNSGMPQGTFLKRHVVPRASDAASPVLWSDIEVGGTLRLYERVYHVIGADASTREFLGAQGVAVGGDQEYPLDDYHAAVEAKRAPTARLTLTKKSNVGTKQFLENDRKVLRFFAVWDDTPNLYGDVLPLALCYYLADDTVEVTEIHQRNSGRDPFPKLLARMRLPKNEAPRPTTAVYKIRARRPEFVHWSDLQVGGTVEVYNRPLFLHDCDAFTRDWYGAQGAEQPERVPVQLEAPPAVAPLSVAPDWYGIGKEADQMQNVLHLIPKPPKGNFLQFMQNDRKTMRFRCKMADVVGTAALSATDATRSFVLSFYLADDTLQIFEPPIRNSGVLGGKFLERQKVKRADGAATYGPSDFYVGATVIIFRRAFVMQEADDFTLALMEADPERFPRSDPGAAAAHVADAVRDALGAAPPSEAAARLQQAMGESDTRGTGHVDATELLHALGLMGAHVDPQAALTLVRAVARGKGALAVEADGGAAPAEPPAVKQGHAIGKATAPRAPILDILRVVGAGRA